jgi:preprotein translocase subunit SecG
MYWYSWLLLALFILACLTLIGSVLLQSGKGDIASALGGGGAQNAFGPRGAASTIAKVTLVAASLYMVLSFLFSMPGILGGGSVASGLDDDPALPATTPTPLPIPSSSPGANATTGESTAPTPSPAASPAATGKTEEKPAENKADDKAKSEGAAKTEANKDAKKDNK